MSFPEYLKERISEDYKNLIIQKLQEIKQESDQLRNSLNPSLLEANQSFRESVQLELAKVQETMEAQWNSIQEKLEEQMNQSVEDYVNSWYHSDISAFQHQLEVLISDVVSNIPTPAKKENADLVSIAELTRNFDQAGTQSEILNILLHHIASWTDRAVLFVIKGEQASGWAAFGLGSDWDSTRVRQIRLNLQKETVVSAATKSGEGAHGAADAFPDNGELFMAIGSTFPRTALAFPIKVRGKIAGILYADFNEELSERPDTANLLFLACHAAGSAIDSLATRPKQAVPAAQPAAAAVRQEIAPKEEPVTQRVTRAPAESAPAEPAPAESVPAESLPAEPATDTPASVPEEPSERSAAEEEVEVDSEPTVVMQAPPKEIMIPEEDRRLHDDAKRFARLLVSEIKLYNEAQVSAGREHKDLYERLKDDIERSRRMYAERVPDHIHSSTNYFYEELVRTLANGDPSLLGM